MCESTEGILPGTRFAVEAYVNFVRDRPILEGIASSLTEMFSPGIIADRVQRHAGELLLHHRGDAGLFHAAADAGAAGRRFRAALREGRGARRRADQEKVLAALRFKCDVLWTQLDALYLAYVDPGLIPPGAFVPK